MLQKIIIFLLSILLISMIIPQLSFAANSTSTPSISVELLENGNYIETIITPEPYNSNSTLSTTKSITKTKTTRQKNANGKIIWSVSIKATFSYDGKTSQCTSCTPSASVPDTHWSVVSLTSSRSGNSATAKAKLTYTRSSGISENFNKSVTIQCSPTGVVS